eukprot:c7130_g1_i1.p1 GENE.c7130_g1_i1~~c7130_g1_i1.p1  ORF type:complete len:809 (-),score=228.26 c7130_g1_i1:34-2190(-)
MGATIAGGVKSSVGDIIDQVSQSFEKGVSETVHNTVQNIAQAGDTVSDIIQKAAKLPVGANIANPNLLPEGVNTDVDISAKGASLPDLKTAFESVPRVPSTFAPQLPEAASRSYSDVIGFPTPEHIFSNIEKKMAAAQQFWDGLMSQTNIQEDARLGIEKAGEALSDAQTNSKYVQSAGDMTDASITSDKAVVAHTNEALEMSQKVLDEDMSIKDIASEAKRWVDKVLEKSIMSVSDSESAKQQVQQAQTLADETLKHDEALRQQIKSMFERSQQAIKEASDARELLVELQKKETVAQSDAAKAQDALLQIKDEEKLLKDHEAELHKKILEEQDSKNQSQQELQQVKGNLQARLDNTTSALQAAQQDKVNLENQLLTAKTELSRVQTELASKAQAAQATHDEMEKQDKEHSKLVQQYLEASAQARQLAETELDREKAAEERADKLEKERDAAEKRTTEKLDLARQRTKEWVHSQLTTLATEDQKKDDEIARLKLEVERLQHEEQTQVEVLKKQLAEQAKKTQPAPQIESVALQLDEGNSLQPKQLQHKAIKAGLLPKLQAAKARVEHLLNMQGVMTPEDLPRDLEMNSDPDYRLKRRIKKALAEASQVPSGYPPPPGTAKLQDVVGLELGEGAGAPEMGYGAPQIVQGVNNSLQPLTHQDEDHCIRICSGGEPTVYRDGQVSSVGTENNSLAHQTGACMKLCAIFKIEESCEANPAKC